MKKIDGRSLRATGRTEPFATRLKPGYKDTVFNLAKKQGCTMAEVLEKAITLYREKGV
jgi:hypothetical protein